MNFDMNFALSLMRDAVCREQVVKMCASAGGAVASAVVLPSVPYISVCWLLVLVDWVSAMALARRVRREYGKKRAAGGGRVSSRRAGRVVWTMVRVAVALLVARAVQVVVVADYPGVDVVKITAAAVCVWQLLSILENEAACNGARWARVARRVVIDKTERHLGVEIDDDEDRGSE